MNDNNENKITGETPVDHNTPLIVDVRTPAENKTGFYPGSINIPLDELPKRHVEFGNDLSRDITVYCASGVRSGNAQNLLKQLGYTNVKNGGGINQMMMQNK